MRRQCWESPIKAAKDKNIDFLMNFIDNCHITHCKVYKEIICHYLWFPLIKFLLIKYPLIKF